MWHYTQQDIKLAQGAVLRLARPETRADRPFGSMGSVSDGNIEFQFPPKVISDSRRGDWEEGHLRGNEPVAAFKTSGPREITLTWSYVVDSTYYNSRVDEAGRSYDVARSSMAWTIDRITKNIRTLRGYYALVREAGDSRKNLVVEFRLWALGGSMGDAVHQYTADGKIDNFAKDYLMSSRLNSIDVKYGDTIVCPRGEEAFFLRTDITVDLRLWTKMGTRGSTDESIMQDVEHMRIQLTPDWY